MAKLSSGPRVDADSLCRKRPPKLSPYPASYGLKAAPLWRLLLLRPTETIFLAQLCTISPAPLFICLQSYCLRVRLHARNNYTYLLYRVSTLSFWAAMVSLTGSPVWPTPAFPSFLPRP